MLDFRVFYRFFNPEAMTYMGVSFSCEYIYVTKFPRLSVNVSEIDHSCHKLDNFLNLETFLTITYKIS